MKYHRPNPTDFGLSRRELLSRCGMGLGALGLASLLGEAGLITPVARASATIPGGLTGGAGPLAPRAGHFPARAKRVVHFFLNGGPSHVDTFDPKPALQTYANKPLPIPNYKTERKTGAAFPSPFKFKKHGQSGLDISELWPHVAQSADELC